MHRRVWFPLALTLLMGLSFFLLDAKPAAAMPAGFQDRFVASVESPTSITPTPDGRLLFTTQPGQVRVFKNGALLGTPALTLGNQVCGRGERGLLGLAVDPDFEANGYVYAYYTYNKFNTCPTKSPADPKNPVNRVSRFTMSGDRIDPNSEKVLINSVPSPNGNHNAGDVHFGKDGLLYISVGDGGCNFLAPNRCQPENNIARYRNVLNGKILRINPDGATAEARIPAGNPFTSTNSRTCADNEKAMTSSGYVCKEIFATGLRNPFRMAFDPDASTTSFRINDVGAGTWEEIDAGQRGADYGWNVCEGRHDNASSPGAVNCLRRYTPPIHEYNHNTTCSSITGAAFVPNDAGWPAKYDRSYLFGDYACGKIFNLAPNARGELTRFGFHLAGRGGPTALAFAPLGNDKTIHGNDKALYYATYAGGSGQIRRISYGVGNRIPNAVAKVTNEETNENYGRAGTSFQFSSQGSNDPDNDTLTYEWDFDYDGTNFDAPTAGAATAEASAAEGSTVTHTYDTPGKKTAALRVTDENGADDIATLEVFPGNESAPQPAIEFPGGDTHFGVGQRIMLRGSATDADQPDNAPTLKWQVLRVHNNSHTHPFDSGEGNTLNMNMPAPEDLTATNPSKNNLMVKLTATDSEGLERTVTRTVYPQTTRMRFASRPPDMLLRVGGMTFPAARTFLSWEGHKVNVSAVRYQRKDGKSYKFVRWSDGGYISHTITTPTTARMYVAVFRRR